MPGTVPDADGRPDVLTQSPTNHGAHIYSNTRRHTYICVLHIYVHMKIKIRKKKYFVVHGRTSKLHPALFLEKIF